MGRYINFGPSAATPPEPQVLIAPGDSGGDLNSIDAYTAITIAMFTRSERAVVFPIFKGYFERRPVDTSEPALLRDHIITTYKDLGRTIDYLTKRRP